MSNLYIDIFSGTPWKKKCCSSHPFSVWGLYHFKPWWPTGKHLESTLGKYHPCPSAVGYRPLLEMWHRAKLMAFFPDRIKPFFYFTVDQSTLNCQKLILPHLYLSLFCACVSARKKDLIHCTASKSEWRMSNIYSVRVSIDRKKTPSVLLKLEADLCCWYLSTRLG